MFLGRRSLINIQPLVSLMRFPRFLIDRVEWSIIMIGRSQLTGRYKCIRTQSLGADYQVFTPLLVPSVL